MASRQELNLPIGTDTDAEPRGPQMTETWLSIWTIYEHPGDYPDGFVVRKFDIVHGKTEPVPSIAFGAPTLETARSLLPAGLRRLPRAETDEPQIVESWI